jgi:hypothetical protein
MIFRVQVIPISREPIEVTATTEPTSSSPAYRYVGPWKDIRGFIGLCIAKGFSFDDIVNDLHKDLPVSFDIDASEPILSLAKFEAVKKL